ncbi:DMT family transporter [Chitinophaga sp. Cy-1792]|uniref:EamA family transporter n=1 Tax=Chitinophaga sp. Cy-1792 TaxID=2608339 RepID=UPI00142367F9|nr:EamA family transporter [Chitinophaga sp. Cy-1792]NIG54068.1 EamA family transporter [Chitinophaga sp. Cy-1792]
MNRYVLLVALGAVCYGTLTSFAKIAYGEGYLAGEITFAQASLGAILLWLLALLANIKAGKKGLAFDYKLILAGATMGCSAYCFYLSVSYIPVSLAIVLLMQVSWISALAEYLVFKKPVSGVQLAAMAGIIAGTVLAGDIIHLQSLHISVVGVVLALAGACFYTMYVLCTSKLGNNLSKLEKSALMTTGSALMILLINLPALKGNVHLDAGLLKWGLYLAVFGTVIPPICFTTGMPKIGPALSAVLLTLELPSVVLSAHLILHEPVTLLQILGILLMMGAIIFLNLPKDKSYADKVVLSTE